MEDKRIVQWYWDRDEKAISASEEKYGVYCRSIAHNILGNAEDEQECVNDTWMGAWNSMPPHRPDRLSVFLGKITRNLSINRYRYNKAEKRGQGQIDLVLDELEQIVSGKESVEEELDRKELVHAINAFLGSLPERQRKIFLCRYWYFDSVKDIAARFEISENYVSVTLNRLRKKLRENLEEGGFDL